MEREFRGFGRVDQIDTEEFAALSSSGAFPEAVNIEATSHVPPVLTKTWFHTGAFASARAISKHFESEYHRESDASQQIAGLTDKQFAAMLLPDTVLPSELDAGETREACRALKGSILRQEIYALDGSEESDRPYTASERSYAVRRLQPLGNNRHPVFFAHERETIDFHYERKLYDVAGKRLADPRVTHSLTLAVDDFGNVLRSVAIGYGRRHEDPDPVLTGADRLCQRSTHVTYTENRYTNAVLEADGHRAPALCESQTFEVLGQKPDATQPLVTNLFRFEELVANLAALESGENDIPYERWESDEATQPQAARRLIEWVRRLYYRNDLSGPLPLGLQESLGLSYEGYKLALTAGLVAAVFVRGQNSLLPDAVNVLRNEGGYTIGEDLELLGHFPTTDATGLVWVGSGQAFFGPLAKVPAPAKPPQPLAQDLKFARTHFFVPQGVRDSFGAITRVEYDAYDLILECSEDALENKVTAEVDYRVLQPFRMTDPNGNRVEVGFDVLGLVAGTALMGKVGETRGDSLAGFKADLSQAELDAWFDAPRGPLASALLASATTRVLYDVGRVYRSNDPGQPTYAATLARETHVSELLPNQQSPVQVSVSYSDGFGREIQKKLQAEPGAVGGGAAGDRGHAVCQDAVHAARERRTG